MDYIVDGQAAYVLHSRPYRDTSLLVDFFTLEHGKVSAVVRGAKRPGSKLRPVLQPFLPLQVNWRGRQELKNLTLAEPVDANPFLSGTPLMCGLYVNELLERLLQPHDPHPHLYVYYQYVINELRNPQDIQGALRTFEHHLLTELGHCPDMTGLNAEQIYLYERGQGLLPVAQVTDTNRMRCFYGRHLTAIEQDSYDQPAVKNAAKRLMRLLIDQLLGDKPLRSRELFQKR